MNDTMIPHKRDPDLYYHKLIVDNACVVVSFPATHQDNDGHILDEVTRILFDSYHPKCQSSASLPFSAPHGIMMV